jgi:hypothetical protein
MITFLARLRFQTLIRVRRTCGSASFTPGTNPSPLYETVARRPETVQMGTFPANTDTSAAHLWLRQLHSWDLLQAFYYVVPALPECGHHLGHWLACSSNRRGKAGAITAQPTIMHIDWLKQHQTHQHQLSHRLETWSSAIQGGRTDVGRVQMNSSTEFT